jgi:hypothetical protein
MPKEKKEKSSIKLIIIFSIIFFIAGGVGGFFIGTSYRAFSRGNFSTLSDTTKNEITTFFNGNPTQEQAATYCQQNMAYCFYYCRQNPTSLYCTQLNLSRSRGMPPQTG